MQCNFIALSQRGAATVPIVLMSECTWEGFPKIFRFLLANLTGGHGGNWEVQRPTHQFPWPCHCARVKMS